MNTFIPTSFDILGKSLYVSQQKINASDANPGTEELSFKTISKAASVMGRYDEIVIDSGVYREEIPISVNGHEYIPEHASVFKAVRGSKVSIKGSDEFAPKWEKCNDNLYLAPLPKYLFSDHHYNPYERSEAIDEPDTNVRPCHDNEYLPTTLGQIFLDGEELRQVGLITELKEGCWRVTSDGQSIIACFKEDIDPNGCVFELTVRKRCFKTDTEGLVILEIRGIEVDHAAEPGPFCRFRRSTFRQNKNSGIAVRKTFNLPGTTTRQCRLFGGEVSYTSTQNNTLKATIYDETQPTETCFVYDAISHDAAVSFIPVSRKREAPSVILEDIFLDEDLDVLVKTKIKWLQGAVTEHGACHIANQDKSMAVYCISDDEGQTWSVEKDIGLNMVPSRMIKLKDKTLLLPCGKNNFLQNDQLHQSTHFFRGRWTEEGEIDWVPGGVLEILPQESSGGLSEPHIAELPDGRVVVLLRMGAMLPSEKSKGAPSVKLLSMSDDGGKSWTNPKALKWDDGHLLYSPRSYQDIFCSRKNGNLYGIMNICDEPTAGCDPRSSLHMIEIDPDTLDAKRHAITIIEEKHPQTANLVRFSNWCMFEDRETLNPIILMRQHMSEYCFNRHGYDLSSYRYEVML